MTTSFPHRRSSGLIVGNRISIQVSVDRSVLRDLEEAERTEVLTQLAGALSRHSINTTVEDLEARIADQRFSPYVPVPVAGRVPEELKIWIDEHAEELPSVSAERVAVADYPYGRVAAPVIGYTGKITRGEADAMGGSERATG